MSHPRILVVCEKPSSASRIAQALDDDRSPEIYKDNGIPYYIAQNGKNELIVVSALGHLYSVTQSNGKWTYPIFDIKWVPAYLVNKKLSRIRPFLEIINKLSKNVQGYISACDYDLEGSLIAYMILYNICTEAELGKAQRMKFSTLSDHDLRASYTSANGLDFQLIDAGKSRHEIDWIYGINLSRALTLSVRNTTGLYRTLSIGRVQGPTLSYIKRREVEIQTFVPIPYWEINAKTRINKILLPLEYNKPRIKNQWEAERIVRACMRKEGTIINSVTQIKKQHPPPPFNVGDLQQEAYNKFKYSPRTTQITTEKLYISALISYPRTSSQQIPPSIDIKSILENLVRNPEYYESGMELLTKKKLKPFQGEKEDSAHPAIHPTGIKPEKLTKNEANIYDLIVRRFISSMGDSIIKEYVKVSIDIEGYLFHLKGKTIREKGWMKYYEPYINEKETPIPPLKIGMNLPIIRIKANPKHTQPPNKYKQSSLVKMMEDRKLGTKATRTDIIDTLYKREYITGNPIKITELGFTIVETLERNVPFILSTELTQELESNIEDIQKNKIDGKTIVEKSISLLKPTLIKFKDKEREIGEEISKTLNIESKKGEKLGPCPTCDTGVITVINNKKTGKRFASCSNYNSGCKQSYPLPQKGKIKTMKKKCSNCGAPLIQLLNYGKKPWEICININCPLKKK